MTNSTMNEVIWVCHECNSLIETNAIHKLAYSDSLCSGVPIQYIPLERYTSLQKELDSYKEVYNKDITGHISKCVHERIELQSQRDQLVDQLEETEQFSDAVAEERDIAKLRLKELEAKVQYLTESVKRRLPFNDLFSRGFNACLEQIEEALAALQGGEK